MMVALRTEQQSISLPLDQVIHGNCLDVLRGFPDCSIDAIVTDPPAGINFMNMPFDSDKGGREHWIAWLTEIMQEALRCLRPGGHAFVWALPRTSHWTATALEDAGFEVKDAIFHHFGSGFPKSLDVRKAAQKAGLACNCQTSVVQYPQHISKETVSHGTLSSLQQATTDQAAEPEIEVLLSEMYGPGSSYLANDQDVRDMRSAMEAAQSLSSSEEYNVSSVQGQEDITSHEGQDSRTSTNGNVQALREGIPFDQWAQDGQLLQPFMPSESQCNSSDTSQRQHEGTEAQKSALWGEKSSMEGRSDVLQETRQLHQREVREMSTGISNNGTQGRLRDGASPSDGSTPGQMSNQNGSGTSHRSQSTKQRTEQPPTIPQQSGAQTCGRCGKAIIQEGLGSALKPSTEIWWLVRKPLSESSIAANVLKWNCGALNIDGCRVPHVTVESGNLAQNTHLRSSVNAYETSAFNANGNTYTPVASGRFPSNLLLSHTWLCTDDDCDNSCPIRILNEQSGIRKSGGPVYPGKVENGFLSGSHRVYDAKHSGSEGGASRYFSQFSPDADDFVPWLYASKASRKERNQGCEGLPKKFTATMNDGIGKREHNPDEPNAWNGNNHPTVKPLQLMRWLCRLITPPDGIVLDPFAGSGSTLCAAISEGFHFIGIEQDESYCTIARSRILHALSNQEVQA